MVLGGLLVRVDHLLLFWGQEAEVDVLADFPDEVPDSVETESDIVLSNTGREFLDDWVHWCLYNAEAREGASICYLTVVGGLSQSTALDLSGTSVEGVEHRVVPGSR